jgi:hypothetical protein
LNPSLERLTFVCDRLKMVPGKARIVCPENSDLATRLLQKHLTLLEYVFEAKTQKLEKMTRFQEIDETDQQLCEIDLLFLVIADNLAEFYEIMPDIAIPFFDETMVPVASQLIESEETMLAGTQLMVDFLIGLNDSQRALELMRLLSQAIDVTKSDFSSQILLQLGKLFLKFPMEDAEFAKVLYDFFVGFLSGDEAAEQDDLPDHALIAFTKFLQVNLRLFGEESALSDWFDCCPLWGHPEDANIVFLFLVRILEDEKGELLGYDWLSRSAEQVLGPILSGDMPPELVDRFITFFKSFLFDEDSLDELRRALDDISPGNRADLLTLLQIEPEALIEVA